jgi:exopolysaccharide biosynthesis WecB/TagA/CpsF family protein
VTVNVRDRESLLSSLAPRLRAGEGFAIATLNLDHLVKLRTDPAFRDAYARHDFVTADGNPVVWLSHLAGEEVDLVTGADLVVPLARAATAAGRTVALVGSTQESLDKAGEALRVRSPGLQIALRIAPPMGFDPDGAEADAILDQLAGAGIGLAFIALGAPKQERLAARGRARAPNVGFASIGAGLDFLSGHQKRAPEWARRYALEWLWRMLSNPRRLFKRYVLSALILPGHALRSLRSKRNRA